MLEVLLVSLVLGWIFYKWWTYPSTYWKDRGITQLQYKLPLGTDSDVALMKKYFGHSFKKLYDDMGEADYAGFIMLRTPHLLLKNPDTVKAIMVKDFIYFTNRVNVDNLNEPLSHHLFNLGGDKWKALRVNLTPTFTSGKLKLMFPLFEACSKNLEVILEKIVASDPEIEVKDLIGRYTTKILGTCAYGIDIDSLGEKDNSFVKLVNRIFSKSVPLLRLMIHLIHRSIPITVETLKFRISSIEMEEFLTSLVLDTINFRKSSPEKRNDFIDLLMEIKTKGEITIDSIEHQGKATIGISDKDIVAQVFVFLAAGFETSASVTSYCLYELAINQNIQDRLRKEIHSGLPLSYQSMQEMQYLDMVVNETMRKYPTLPILSRKCTKRYTMPDGCVIDKGTRVMIPVYALHHDPRHYPDPDRFDPERFTPENKNDRHQYTFLPFGEGPRLCIGMRFGLLQTKMGIATIISKYRLEITPDTVTPLKFAATPLISTVSHPIKLAFRQL